MIQLKSDRLSHFLSRFHEFDDSVVRTVSLSVGSASRPSRAVVSLAARDSETATNDWVRLRLTISGVTEYRLAETLRVNHSTLSLGLVVGSFDGVYYFNFAPDTTEPEGLDDYRDSEFYIAGRDYKYVVLPYPKSW